MVVDVPDPEWYFEHVLYDAEPGGPAPSAVGPVTAWQRWWRDRPRDGVLGVAREQGFVLTSAQLAAAGVSRSARRHAVARGRWVQAARGVVGVVDIRDAAGDRFAVERRRHALVAAGAALARRDHVVCGRSAAILDGLPTLTVPQRPELTECGPSGCGRRERAHLYAATLTSEETTAWFGVPVTTVARTLVDLARRDRQDAIMAADAALREGLTTTCEIEAALALARGWPGVRRAREVLRMASPKAESPLESLVRLAMYDDGFPAPELQFQVGPYWADLALPAYGLLIEADGRGKYTDEALWEEKLREQYFRRAGWWTERVIWADVRRHWPATSRRLRAAMRSPSPL